MLWFYPWIVQQVELSFEEAIHHIYIPALTGYSPPNNQGCSLLVFPLHLGGLQSLVGLIVMSNSKLQLFLLIPTDFP